MDIKDLYIKYDELVEEGEIDPELYPVETWTMDQITDAIDHDYEYVKDQQ